MSKCIAEIKDDHVSFVFTDNEGSNEYTIKSAGQDDEKRDYINMCEKDTGKHFYLIRVK